MSYSGLDGIIKYARKLNFEITYESELSVHMEKGNVGITIPRNLIEISVYKTNEHSYSGINAFGFYPWNFREIQSINDKEIVLMDKAVKGDVPKVINFLDPS